MKVSTHFSSNQQWKLSHRHIVERLLKKLTIINNEKSITNLKKKSIKIIVCIWNN